MNLMAFSRINKECALEEDLQIVLRRGFLSHRFLSLVDFYCINPGCDCEAAHLDVYRMDGKVQGFELDPATGKLRLSGEKTGYKSDIIENPVRLTVDLPRGTVDFPKGHEAKGGETEILDQVREGLTQQRLEILRRHYRESKAWGRDHYWKYADWSHLKEGLCVGWAEVFPWVPAWTFEEGGATYAADDQYCINPSCSCEEVILTFTEIRRAGGARPSTLGAVTCSVVTGRRGVHTAERGRLEELLRLAGVLFSRVGGLADELRRRRSFMQEFGRHVAEQRRRAEPVPARAAPAPGRNAPCPCGSGKKHKKCCLPGRRESPGQSAGRPAPAPLPPVPPAAGGKGGVLLKTTTDELFLPSRVVYRVFDREQFLKRISGLRCLVSDGSSCRWAWNYEAEAKGLGFGTAYDCAPAKPLLLASCYWVEPDGFHVYVRSAVRLTKCLVFFDRHVPRTCARAEFLDQYNLLTVLDADKPSADRLRPEDFFRDESKLLNMDVELEAAFGAEDAAKSRDWVWRHVEEELQPLTRVRLEAFYEDGEDHMVHSARLREILAIEQHRSNQPIRPFEFLVQAFKELDAGSNA